jgi:hypothetical protein
LLIEHEKQSNMQLAASVNVSPGLVRQATPDVGNVLVATSAWSPGQVLVEDVALVHATWEDGLCFACDQPHASQSCTRVQAFLPAPILANLEEIEAHLVQVEAVGELDRARTLIKTLVHCKAQPNSALADVMRTLTVANIDR